MHLFNPSGEGVNPQKIQCHPDKQETSLGMLQRNVTEEYVLFKNIIHDVVMFAVNIRYRPGNIGLMHHPFLGEKLRFSLQFEGYPELQTKMVCNHFLPYNATLLSLSYSLLFFPSVFTLIFILWGVLLCFCHFR